MERSDLTLPLLTQVRPILRDLGMEFLPHISEDYFWVSEAVFYPAFILGFASLFGCFIWGIMIGPVPKIEECANVSTIFRRLMIHITICQTLRAASFMFTILPGPADHCQATNHTQFNKPEDALEVLTRMDPTHGCGDLIFSSHTIFSLTLVLLTTKYMHNRLATYLVWTFQIALIPLIIASHKHYTVNT